MVDDRTATCSAVQLAAMIRTGECTSRDLLELYLDRIERLLVERHGAAHVIREAKPTFRGVKMSLRVGRTDLKIRKCFLKPLRTHNPARLVVEIDGQVRSVARTYDFRARIVTQ